jgi:hypothetical protein
LLVEVVEGDRMGRPPVVVVVVLVDYYLGLLR